MPLLFGLETEYALSARRVSPFDPALATEIVALAREHWPYLRGLHSAGVFLANGSRLYCDCARLEIGGPECVTPQDAVRYSAAADAIVADLIERYRVLHNQTQAFASKVNVCYATGATAGCHESYAFRERSAHMPRHLVPFLVARQILTGAGGFNNRSWGLDFCISPRVLHLRRTISESSTSDRGIFHTRSESLASHGWQRLHVLAGDALASHTGTWIKMAFTALVVALIDAGRAPGRRMTMKNPVAAIAQITADPTCQAAVPMQGQGELTAVAILRHYLARIEEAIGAIPLPDWAALACHRIRELLDRIEQSGAAGVETTLDWAIKHALFTRFLHRRGYDWVWVEQWNGVVKRMAQECAHLAEVYWLRPPAGGGAGLPDNLRECIQRHLSESQRTWDDFEHFQTLRATLLELDVRFTQLGGDGVFDLLDRQGVLDHRLSDVDDIPGAMIEPPAGSRATVRGRCVRQFAGQSQRYACDWEGVWDFAEKKRIDLTEPFTTEGDWTTANFPEPAPSRGREGLMAQFRHRIGF